MSEKSVFRDASSPEMTSKSFPVSCFLFPQFCTSPEVTFDVFGTSKHGERKSLSNNYFAILISTLETSYRANKKNCHIHFKQKTGDDLLA